MSEWFLIALAAPFLWALVTTIDVYFVNDVYEDEYDGAFIAGMLQLVVWLLVPLGILHFTFPGFEAALWVFLAGASWIAYTFYYFRTLFAYNDSVLMQILGNVSVLLVPFFAWILVGERLTPIHYVGIAIAFIGVTIFSFDRTIAKGKFSDVAPPMLLAVTALSLSMVFGKKAYEISDDFWNLFLIYCLGSTTLAVALIAIRPREVRKRISRIVQMSKRYFWIFLFTEGMIILGTLASQRAISLAPAVSFVAVIESLTPVFAVILSVTIAFFLARTSRKELGQVYRNQMLGLRSKVFATLLLSIGIYIVSVN